MSFMMSFAFSNQKARDVAQNHGMDNLSQSFIFFSLTFLFKSVAFFGFFLYPLGISHLGFYHLASKRAPPATFPRAEAKIQTITLLEDVYVKKFSAFDPPPSCVFGLRVLELKDQGVSEEQAMAIADKLGNLAAEAQLELRRRRKWPPQ
ncbi:hypothetical protein CR513_45346, partial [Mucuna pruriens]